MMTQMNSAEKEFDKGETLKAKGIAICLLLFHHLFFNKSRVNSGGIVPLFLSIDQLNAIGTGARVCVFMFVFLSAYGLSVQYKKRKMETSGDRWAFFRHYYISLMKPYWFIFVIVTLLSFLIFRNPIEVYEHEPVYGILSFLGLSDVFATPMPNNTWWYMACAQIILILVPFLYELIRRFGPIVLPLAFVLTQYMGTGITSSFGGAYIQYLYSVLLGVWFAESGIMTKLSRRWNSRLLNAAEGILLLAAAVGCIYVSIQYQSIDKWRFTKIFISVGALLIILFSFRHIGIKGVEKTLGYLGKHSGNIFLIHSFGYNYYIKAVFWSHNVIVTFLTLLVMSLLVSMLFEWLKTQMRRTSLLRKLV